MEAFVYAISNGKSIKIGKAKNPDQRVKELQTGSSTPLRIVSLIRCQDQSKARQVESALHRFFQHAHQHLEWFDIEESSVKAAFELAHYCMSTEPLICPDPIKHRTTALRLQSKRQLPNLSISPLMLQVADWLLAAPTRLQLSSRQIAREFTEDTGKSVSYVWVQVAKQYAIKNREGHTPRIWEK